jgi:hypothetical protein
MQVRGWNLCFFVPTVYLACPIPLSPLLGTMLAYASIGAPELRLDGGITFLLYTVCDCDPSPFSGIAEEESEPRTALLQPPTLSSIVYRVLQRRIVSCLELMVASSSSKLNRDAILLSHTMYRHWLGAISATMSSSTLPTTSPSPNPSGLSTGAKIGIGVGLPVAILAFLLLGFLLWRRRRAQRTVDGSEHVYGSPAENLEYKDAPVHELYGAPGGYDNRHELPGVVQR